MVEEPEIFYYDAVADAYRLDDRLGQLVEEVAGRPLCKWCADEVYERKERGMWFHHSTGSGVCAGQLRGSWDTLHRAEPLTWRVAE